MSFPLLKGILKLRGFCHNFGQQKSIPVRVNDDGLVVDGRNRLCASIVCELDVSLQRFNPSDPVQYVLSENLHRRHLSVGQKAMLALEVEQLYAVDAKERQKSAGGDRRSEDYQKSVPLNSAEPIEKGNSRERESRKKAAKSVGVGHDSVQRAKKIDSVAPAIAQKVKQHQPRASLYRRAISCTDASLRLARSSAMLTFVRCSMM